MSSKSSGVGLGTIIFWGFLCFMWFGDSDDSDTNVEIVSQDDIVVEEQVTTVEETIADNFNNMRDDLSDIVDKVKINIEDTMNQIQEDVEVAETEPTIEEPEEVEVIQQDQEDELKPITNNQENEELKKL